MERGGIFLGVGLLAIDVITLKEGVDTQKEVRGGNGL